MGRYLAIDCFFLELFTKEIYKKNYPFDQQSFYHFEKDGRLFHLKILVNYSLFWISIRRYLTHFGDTFNDSSLKSNFQPQEKCAYKKQAS